MQLKNYIGQRTLVSTYVAVIVQYAVNPDFAASAALK